jgi:hypothetical protein
VLDAWPPDARAVAATVVLAALPGVLVVRSPWRAMPQLSLAFWVLSWTWLGGASRTRLLHVVLAGLCALAVLRVMRPGPLPRPGRAHLLLAAVALASCLPYAFRAVPSGPRMPLESLTAELLSWRDGWPASFEPLLPLAPLQASGVATLAGDVVLLTGVRPHRAALVVTVLADLVLILGLWSLAAVRLTPTASAVTVAIAALATAGHAAGPGTLAAALAVEAVALWHDRRGHPSAFAAGACSVAALAADVTTGLAALALAAAGVRVAWPPHDGRVTGSRDRLRTAVLTAAVLALPLALRMPPIHAAEGAPLVAVGIVIAAGAAWGDPTRRPRPQVAVAILVAAVVTRAWNTTASGSDDVASGDLAAMEWIRAHARPLDVVCAPSVPAARWIPAIAGRPTNVPVSPGWPAPSGPCGMWLSLSGASVRNAPASGPPALSTTTATVWTTSQSR